MVEQNYRYHKSIYLCKNGLKCGTKIIFGGDCNPIIF